ncbi:MAG: hypothetical protein Q9191_003139 [Dirinaria sp. TL-2023a]
MPLGPPPPGGDQNRAAEVHAFTWSLEIVSMIFVVSRMYSRIRLTRNMWWDDFCVCFALILDVIISVIWSVYAERGYARHLYYIQPSELPDIIKLNTVSRSLCMFSIAIGKISVALLIERIAGPSRWRKWLLRSISVSVFITAVITLTFFYAQCQPARAVWDKALVKEGKAHCWNPHPINTWNLVIASYWAFLDFALALIPVDMIWKLQLTLRRKLLVSCLLGMGVFAGICASVKTSKVPITVNAKADITWATVELLMWNGIEMNVIIIAACIPTLRPLFLILLRRSTPSDFLPSRQNGQSYQKHASSDPTSDSSKQSHPTVGSRASKVFSNANKALDVYRNHTATQSTDSTQGLDQTGAEALSNKNSILVSETICVESREVRGGSEDSSDDEREWGRAGGVQGVPLSEIGKPMETNSTHGDERTVIGEDERQVVRGEDMV